MRKADDPLVHQGEELCQESAKAAAEVQARKEALLYNLHKAIKERNLQALNDLETEIIEDATDILEADDFQLLSAKEDLYKL